MPIPFHVNDLLSCVQAVLRRARWKLHDPPVPCSSLEVGELTLEVAQPLIRLADRTVVLTPVEYDLLTCLAQQAGSLIPTDELLEQVWGAGYEGKHVLLRATITRLRQKLELDPLRPRYLLTHVGRGYRLVNPASNTMDNQSG